MELSFRNSKFGPFRKYYGLRTSELPLAKLQRLKRQDFGIPLFTQTFFCLPTIPHEQLSPKSINHIIFCNNSISSSCTKIYFPNYDKLFAVISRKYKKNTGISDILKNTGMGVNMITRQITHKSLILLKLYPFACFKACKIQFHGLPASH